MAVILSGFLFPRVLIPSCDSLQSCQLIPNPETGKHKGYGFVEFETEDAAKGAIQCMNGFQLGGRQLKVGLTDVLLSCLRRE